MSWHLERISGKHHRPRHGRGAAPELAVDEISQPPKKESLRSAQGKRVGDRPEWCVVSPREGDAGDAHPEHRTVKRQSTLSDSERPQRVRLVCGEIVNENIY